MISIGQRFIGKPNRRVATLQFSALDPCPVYRAVNQVAELLLVHPALLEVVLKRRMKFSKGHS